MIDIDYLKRRYSSEAVKLAQENVVTYPGGDTEGEITCILCGFQWNAIYPAKISGLRCPRCFSPRGLPPHQMEQKAEQARKGQYMIEIIHEEDALHLGNQQRGLFMPRHAPGDRKLNL